MLKQIMETQKEIDEAKDFFETTNPLKLNLQFFGDPNDPPEDPPADPPEEDPEDKDTTFTQSEVDSQISKAVDSALKKQQAKLEKEKQAELDKAKAEAAEYAKLTQKEKEEADYNKRVKALEDREQELNNKELLSQIESDLKENELPPSFAQSLLAIQDNEKIKESITDIKKQFDEAVNEAVKGKLRQDTPPAGSNSLSNNKAVSVKDIAEENRLIK